MILKKLSKLTNKNREPLNCILLKKGGTAVATDSFILAEVQTLIKNEEDILISPDILDENNYQNYISNLKVDDYPEYRKAFPSSDVKCKAKVNISLLKRLLSLFENNENVDLLFYEEGKPLVIQNELKTKIGLIMPIREE
jgi:hypothetical protein